MTNLSALIAKYDHIVNDIDIEENFWGSNYVVSLTSQCTTFVVNADHVTAAFDEVMDYIVESGLTSLYTKVEPEFSEDYIRCGNYGYWFTTYNINYKEIF